MGRPLKVYKINGGIDVDLGFPNDGTTDNNYDNTKPGIVGGDIPAFDASNVVYAGASVEQKQYGVVNSTAGISVIWGDGDTDYLNTVAAGSLIYAGSALTDPTVAALGTVNTVNTPVTVTIDASVAGVTDRFTTKGAVAATALVANGPVVFSVDYAGLTGGVVYYVKTVNDGTHFQVSATPGGAVLDLTAETADITAQQYPSITLDDGATETVTNGAWTSATPDNAFIVRQRGKRKFLVARREDVQDEFIAAGGSYIIKTVGNTDWAALGAGPDAAAGKVFTASTNGVGLGTTGAAYAVGICLLTDAAKADLTRNQMSIVLTPASDPAVKAATLSNHFTVDFTDNGTDENAGKKYIATFNGKTDTVDLQASLLTSVSVDSYC
jgi:hypothetical protein